MTPMPEHGLDQVRRDAWNAAVGRSRDAAITKRLATETARALKNARWAQNAIGSVEYRLRPIVRQCRQLASPNRPR